MEKLVCEQARAECNKRSSYSVRGSREEKVQLEKKLPPETKEETYQREADTYTETQSFTHISEETLITASSLSFCFCPALQSKYLPRTVRPTATARKG